MTISKRRGLSVMLLTLAWMTPSLAYDLWIEPSPLSPRGSEPITLRLLSAERFGGPAQFHLRQRIGMFEHLYRSGRRDLGRSDGGPTAVQIDRPESGVHLVAYASKPETRAVGDGVERYFGKSLLVVGDAVRGDPIRWSELGHRLEIIPQSDAVDLFRDGGDCELQVLFEREPAAEVAVVAIPASDPESGRQTARTDEIGVVRFRLDRPGLWMIKVQRAARCLECAGSDREYLTAVLTLAAKLGR